MGGTPREPFGTELNIQHGAGVFGNRYALARYEPGTEPAYVFEDRQTPGDWHVQWTADDGGFEMAIFSGPRAHERAIMFAERCYGSYEQVRSNQG